MKRIKETPNEAHWPRHKVASVECRPRDLVLRVTDWTDDQDEPAYDVEVYIGGVYDWNESQVVTRWESQHAHPMRPNGRPWKGKAKRKAIAFAQAQLAKLL